MHTLGRAKTKVALETLVAPVRADEKHIVENRLHQAFSPGTVN
jgi:hypothetical protein